MSKESRNSSAKHTSSFRRRQNPTNDWSQSEIYLSQRKHGKDQLNPEGWDIYTENEAKYAAAFLKQMIEKKNDYNNAEDLKKTHEKAKTTVELLIDHLNLNEV